MSEKMGRTLLCVKIVSIDYLYNNGLGCNSKVHSFHWTTSKDFSKCEIGLSYKQLKLSRANGPDELIFLSTADVYRLSLRK